MMLKLEILQTNDKFFALFSFLLESLRCFGVLVDSLNK